MSDSLRGLFGNKNFRLLFTGNALSGVGQGMTIIGAQWYIAQHFPSSHVLGAIMTVTIVASMLAGPYFGALIDRHKRKNLLLIENVCGFVGLGAMSLLGVFGSYTLISLGAVYLFTVMIFNLHFPATYALTQESFSPQLYGRISGILEVVTQTSAIVAGGLTGYILESVGLPMIFAIDSLTYAVSFFFLMSFQYEVRVGITKARRHFIGEMRIALGFLRSRPRFTAMNIALIMPFLVLVSLDLVQPFYVSQTMHAPANVFSLMNCFYAAGATAAGLWMRNFSLSVGNNFAYVSAFLLFAGSLAALAIFPVAWLVFIMMVLVGWCNAGVRVNRISLIMHAVPVDLIGRINMFFGFAGSCIRSVMLLYLTWGIDALGAQWCYVSMGIILMISLWMYSGSAKKNEVVIAGNTSI